MRFHVVTNVWGERHTDLFVRTTLPNLLSAGNLPALARDHKVSYRVYTTPEDQVRIGSSEPGRRLAEIASLEFITPLGGQVPDVFYHVHWFHRAAAEAKRAGAIAVFVAPDSLWSDGTFKRCGEVMQLGYKAAVTPFLQVVAETCIPDAIDRFGGQPDGSMLIPPSELYQLGMRHLHPLTALTMPKSPHGRPAIDLHWPVQREGIMLRYAIRELFAFDPRRCPITFLWYAGGAEDHEGIYIASGPDDMGMLSVDPLAKYHFNYIVNHRVTPADLVRSTLHPWNLNDQTRVFARRRMYWHSGARIQEKWRRAELRSDLAMREVQVRRSAQRLWGMLQEINCRRAAGILALALEATPLARRWREDLPLTVFAPSDDALAGLSWGAPNQQLGVSPEPARASFSRRVVRRLVSIARRVVLRGLSLLRRIGLGGAADFIKRVLKGVVRRLRRQALAPAAQTAAASTPASPPDSAELHPIERLLTAGSEHALMQFLKGHAAPGTVGKASGRVRMLDGTACEFTIRPSGSQIDGRNVVRGPFEREGITVWVVDKPLAYTG